MCLCGCVCVRRDVLEAITMAELILEQGTAPRSVAQLAKTKGQSEGVEVITFGLRLHVKRSVGGGGGGKRMRRGGGAAAARAGSKHDLLAVCRGTCEPARLSGKASSILAKFRVHCCACLSVCVSGCACLCRSVRVHVRVCKVIKSIQNMRQLGV